MSFRDLSEFLDPRLRLPVGGKTYVIEPIPLELGAKLQLLMELGRKNQLAQRKLARGEELTDDDRLTDDELATIKMDDAREDELYRRVLGATYGELAADGVPLPYVQHVGRTVMAWIDGGVSAAEAFWEKGAQSPEAPAPAATQPPAPNRATRRQASSARARTTSARASGSGTSPSASRPQS